MTHSIALHIRPDFDAIGAAWLLERFMLSGAEIRFIKSGQTDETATAVVDTGGELNFDTLRFDHHQIADNTTSATEQVWDYLLNRNHKLEYLAELVRLIDDCDRGVQSETCDTSRRLGIHALLSAKRTANASDLELWQYGCQLLDDLASGLLVHHKAQVELNANIEWDDMDLGVCVLKHDATHGCTFAAYDRGYELVFYSAQVESGGYVRGVMRRSGSTRYDCGAMVAATIECCKDEKWNELLLDELSSWYQHPAGFFAGISEKGGAATNPPALPMVRIALEIIDIGTHYE